MKKENEKYDAIIPKTIFHYTSFEKFKCILQYGTWRFKLSTQSNDLLDTTYIVDLIKKLKIQNKDLPDDHLKLSSTLSYIESVEKTAPFLKHQFWEEENEYRAAFNLRSSKKPHDDFIDITITEDLMDKKQSRGTGIIYMN